MGVVASGWQEAAALLPICTIPFIPVAGLHEHHPEFVFFARILRPAIWLGLLDFEDRKEPDDRWRVRRDFVRKTPQFDDVLKFTVELTERSRMIHSQDELAPDIVIRLYSEFNIPPFFVVPADPESVTKKTKTGSE